MAGRPKRAEDLERLDLDIGLAEAVWTMLEEGRTYSKICLTTGLGKAALLEWLDSPANSDRHEQARARAAMALVDEALDIADSSGDSKLSVGQRNWIAERMNRPRFGQQQKIEVAGQVTHAHLHALQAQAKQRQVEHNPSDVVDVVAKAELQQLQEL